MQHLKQQIEEQIDVSNLLVIEKALNTTVIRVRPLCGWQKRNKRYGLEARRSSRIVNRFSSPCGHCWKCLLLNSKQEIYCGKAD